MKKLLLLILVSVIAIAAYEANADKLIPRKGSTAKQGKTATTSSTPKKKTSAQGTKKTSGNSSSRSTKTAKSKKRSGNRNNSSYGNFVMSCEEDSVMSEEYFTWDSDTTVCEPDQTGYEFLIEPVDLGLPSRTIWSDRNVAGDNWLDYGLLFAFGCTEVMDTYPDNVSADLYDSQDIAATERDVAFLLYDFGWQQPNVKQWKELCDYCTVEAYSDGLLFTGPNGAQMAIPYTPGYESDMVAVLWTSEKGSVIYIDGSGDSVTYQILKDIPANIGLPLRAIAIK